MTQHQGSLRGLVPCWTNYTKIWQESNTTVLYISEIPSAEHWERVHKNQKNEKSIKKIFFFFYFQPFIKIVFSVLWTLQTRIASDLSSIILLSLADCYSHSTTNNSPNVPGTVDIIEQNSHWPQLNKCTGRKKKYCLFLFPNVLPLPQPHY